MRVRGREGQEGCSPLASGATAEVATCKNQEVRACLPRLLQGLGSGDGGVATTSMRRGGAAPRAGQQRAPSLPLGVEIFQQLFEANQKTRKLAV